MATIYYGSAVTAQVARELTEQLRGLAPGLEVDLVAGGQPDPDYIISLE
ncbi:MAG: hypothetical protein ACYDAG_00910 [Chloroflexota bacterium]